MQNVKLAFRTLAKTPFVTMVAVLSLALGIGANAAIYSLFDQILMSPLPVPRAAELVNLGAPGPKPGGTSCNQAGDCDQVFSYPMFRDLEQKQQVFTGLVGHVMFGASLGYSGREPTSGDGVAVSGSYFPTLELRPGLGRVFGPSEDVTVGGHFITVLSYAYWQSQLGGDPDVVGKSITVNGKHFEIIGVAPQGFQGTTLGSRPDLYVPLTMWQAIGGWTSTENRRQYYIYAFGRLKPGVTLDQARAGLNALYTPIITDVEAPLQEGMSEATLARFKAKKIEATPGARGQSSVHQEARTPLILLFSVTGTVLLIACANIANLLLARGAGRATEMGVRLAIGAGRRHLIVQLLTEAVVLALMGGLVSLVVAQWTLTGMGALLPSQVSEVFSFSIRPVVMAFTAALAVITGLVFGLFPALHSTRSDLITSIRAGAGQIAGARKAQRFRASLVTVQIAMATALLVSAGLFLKSLVNVTRVDLGVKVDDVVTFRISPDQSGYDSTGFLNLYQRVDEQLRALPQVTGVTMSMVPLIAGSNWGNDVYVQGFAHGPDVDNNSRFNRVGPGYFSTLGVQMIDGREFTSSDVVGAPRVAVVNEAFAKKFSLGRDAVGKFISNEGPDSLNIQVIGLAKNAKYSDVKDSVPPIFFLAAMQNRNAGSMSFYIKTGGDPRTLVQAIGPLMKGIDPNMPVEELKTMPQQIRENIFMDRMISILSAAFAALATILAGVGLYGVLSYTVAQRTREIGVRMALGADARAVQAMVLRQVSVMMAIGGVVGLGAALGIGKAAKSLLYGLEGNDPLVFLLSMMMLAAVALAAGYAPARRASKVDPMQALRYE